MDPWLLLPQILLFLDTLLPREKDGLEGVAAVVFCFFCVRGLGSRDGNCNGLLENTALSSADSRILKLYRLSKKSSDGIFDIDYRTSFHLVSNS